MSSIDRSRSVVLLIARWRIRGMSTGCSIKWMWLLSGLCFCWRLKSYNNTNVHHYVEQGSSYKITCCVISTFPADKLQGNTFTIIISVVPEITLLANVPLTVLVTPVPTTVRLTTSTHKVMPSKKVCHATNIPGALVPQNNTLIASGRTAALYTV